MKRIILYPLLLLLITPIALADMIWPAVILEGGILTWWIIGLSLIIEYFFVKKITNTSVKKSIIITLAINAASTIIGIILIPMLGLLLIIPVWLITYFISNGRVVNLIGFITTYILAVFVNNAIEFGVLKLFKCKLTKNSFLILLIANAITIGIALLYILLTEIHF